MLDTLMAASLWWCVLFLDSVTQAFVCPAAARSTLPVLTQPRPIMDSGKVALLAIDGNDGPPSPPPEPSFPSSTPPAPPFADGSSGAPPDVPHSPGEDPPETSDGGVLGRLLRRWRQPRAGQPPGTPAPPPAPTPPPAAAAAAAATAADQDAEESFYLLSLLPLPMAKTFWREATKNFASKAVQRQQGEELIKLSGELEKLSGKLDAGLLLLGTLLVLSFALQVFSLGVFLGRTGQ